MFEGIFICNHQIWVKWINIDGLKIPKNIITVSFSNRKLAHQSVNITLEINLEKS